MQQALSEWQLLFHFWIPFKSVFQTFLSSNLKLQATQVCRPRHQTEKGRTELYIWLRLIQNLKLKTGPSVRLSAHVNGGILPPNLLLTSTLVFSRLFIVFWIVEPLSSHFFYHFYSGRFNGFKPTKTTLQSTLPSSFCSKYWYCANR